MWVLVTGGAKRLGAELCLALARNGYAVAIHYNHSRKEALEVAHACQALGSQAEIIQGDFSSIAQVEEFAARYLEQFPETFALINNVGEYLIGSALETSIQEWNALFQVNLHAPFILCQRLMPSLIKSQGRIINLGVSGLMGQKANIHRTAYYLTKQGLWGLTLALALELTSQKVTVNMVSPGQLEISVDLPSSPEKLPMQRPGYCWEVCRVVNFLLDPLSEYITGQNIEVAGGLGLA